MGNLCCIFYDLYQFIIGYIMLCFCISLNISSYTRVSTSLHYEWFMFNIWHVLQIPYRIYNVTKFHNVCPLLILLHHPPVNNHPSANLPSKDSVYIFVCDWSNQRYRQSHIYMGLIYISNHDTGWMSYHFVWCNHQPLPLALLHWSYFQQCNKTLDEK